MSQNSQRPPMVSSIRDIQKGVWWDWTVGIKSGWEDTPWWMFWKPTKRRLVIPPKGVKRLYEYQHPAFVAREALEDYCAPREEAHGYDRNASYVVGYGSRYRLDNSDLIRTS